MHGSDLGAVGKVRAELLVDGLLHAEREGVDALEELGGVRDADV